ncbi:MAG: PilZ domain-containing protein [Candidatus Omnitrophica bacterium]|nr:PilZ domain-containing protein [Candidatus Omnitrophota bacterium]
MGNDINEKRKYLRLDTVNIVKVTLDRKLIKKPSEFVSAFTKNISVEGVCFLSDKFFEKGKRLRIDMSLPGDPKPLRLRGKVCWSRLVKDKNKTNKVFEVGVELFTVGESDSTRFMGYVCRHMTSRLGRYLHL